MVAFAGDTWLERLTSSSRNLPKVLVFSPKFAINVGGEEECPFWGATGASLDRTPCRALKRVMTAVAAIVDRKVTGHSLVWKGRVRQLTIEMSTVEYHLRFKNPVVVRHNQEGNISHANIV
jgi:hypothetical protein